MNMAPTNAENSSVYVGRKRCVRGTQNTALQIAVIITGGGVTTETGLPSLSVVIRTGSDAKSPDIIFIAAVNSTNPCWHRSGNDCEVLNVVDNHQHNLIDIIMSHARPIGCDEDITIPIRHFCQIPTMYLIL